MSDVDEFLEIVGTERKPVYHYYVLSSGMIKEIRKDDHSDSKTWPIIWSNKIKNREQRINTIKKIREEVDSGKADTEVHNITWE